MAAGWPTPRCCPGSGSTTSSATGTCWPSNRLTLTGAFQQAGWQTVGVEPAVTRAWPEGKFFGYEQDYDAEKLGYQGPKFSYATMPDQYTLAIFQRTGARTGRTRR